MNYTEANTNLGLDNEIIAGKTSVFVFLLPVVSLVCAAAVTILHAERRWIAFAWCITLLLFYHYYIERAEMHYYGFSASGITEYHLFSKKVRHILWSDVAQIGIRQAPTTDGKTLVITLKGTKLWNTNWRHRDSAWYYLFNRPGVLMVQGGIRARRIIEEYYGALDY